jgi:hypothetical protein
MYLYIYKCIYMYIYIHTYLYVYTCIYIYIHLYSLWRGLERGGVGVNICVWKYMYIYECVYIFHIYVNDVTSRCVYVYMCIYVCTYLRWELVVRSLWRGLGKKGVEVLYMTKYMYP